MIRFFNKQKHFTRKFRISWFSKKNKQEQKLIFSPNLDKEYKMSNIYKFRKLLKSKDANEVLKSVFLLKDFIIPDSKKDKIFAALIKKSYFYLVLTKLSKIMMPLSMKGAINSLTI